MNRVPSIPFEPLGITTSQVGFGCGTLVGRSTLKEAAAIIEAALDVGIRYFDAAPTYGMGTAEEVLGLVVGNSSDVVIATKVGYGRSEYSARKNLLRKYLKPILDRSRALKSFARSFYAGRQTSGSQAFRKPRDLSETTVRRSLEKSLSLLRRDYVDVFLAHDPDDASLTDEARSLFESFQKEGLVRCFGVAASDPCDRSIDFGGVWQSAWPRNSMQLYDSPCAYIHHGVIRSAAKTKSGATREHPSLLLRDATRSAPKALFLVATSTPRKLRSLVAHL